MPMYRAFNAEHFRRMMFQRITGKFLISAHAEEEPTAETTPSINFEQAIARARKEEKDKLYPRIQKLEEDNKALQGSVNKYLLENAALKEELEKQKNKPQDPKIKELEDKVASLEAENKTLKESTPNEDEIRQKVAKEYEVKLYAQEQIAANKGSILSILTSEITGTTKEEIDTAIANAKEKTRSIKKDLGLDVDDEEDDDSKKSGGKKTPPAQKKQKKAPAASPASDSDGEEFDAEYIRNLDPRSKEYAEFRKKMGLR